MLHLVASLASLAHIESMPSPQEQVFVLFFGVLFAFSLSFSISSSSISDNLSAILFENQNTTALVAKDLLILTNHLSEMS